MRVVVSANGPDLISGGVAFATQTIISDSEGNSIDPVERVSEGVRTPMDQGTNPGRGSRWHHVGAPEPGNPLPLRLFSERAILRRHASGNRISELRRNRAGRPS
jgi:hypothetical protein